MPRVLGYNRSAMLVRDIGEFGVIERLNRMVVGRGSANHAVHAFPLLVDTGDDTAVWQAGEGKELFTTDTMVEGIHFTRPTTPWRDLGWKAIAANISDIASMGGQPTYALITLGLPPETEVGDLEEMYRGMLEIGDEFGMAIVGGDIVGSPALFITTALVGVTDNDPLLRSTAQPGDAIVVSDYVGSSGGGLKLMLDRPCAGGEAADFLRRAHRRPVPAVQQGQVLARAGVCTAMDVSDGLADDLSKLCTASGVAARIRESDLPVHPMLRREYPEECLSLALGGGEDYVLLFTGPRETVGPLLPLLGAGAAIIGRIEPASGPERVGAVTTVNDAGVEVSAVGRGWDHFGRS